MAPIITDKLRYDLVSLHVASHLSSSLSLQFDKTIALFTVHIHYWRANDATSVSQQSSSISMASHPLHLKCSFWFASEMISFLVTNGNKIVRKNNKVEMFSLWISNFYLNLLLTLCWLNEKWLKCDRINRHRSSCYFLIDCSDDVSNVAAMGFDNFIESGVSNE